jgi:hypothetical protein
MLKKDFQDSLRLTKIALLVSGIRITKTRYKPSLTVFFDFYVYYFNLIWLATDILGEINWLINAMITGRSFVDASLSMTTITVCFMAIIKSITLYWQRHIVVEVIDKLEEIHPAVTAEDNLGNDTNRKETKDNILENDAVLKDETVEKNILRESGMMLNLIVLMQCAICVVVVVAFPLMPVVSMVYEYYTTGKTDYKYPYFTNYFFNTDTMTMWPFVYFHQVWSS